MRISVSPLVCVLGDAQAGPGSKGYHFPGAEVLHDGTIYLIARRDKGMNDPWGVNEAVKYDPRSGRITPMPSPTQRELDRDGARSAYMCYVTELAPDELIAVYDLLTPGTHATMFDEKTYGICPCALRMTRSHDGGLTWDEPEDVAYRTKDVMVPGKIIRTKDGIVGFHVEMHNNWEAGYAEPIQARFVYSVDGGRTFDRAALIPHDRDFLAGDARPTMDGSGRLCSFFWGFDLKTMKDLAVYRAFSADGGRSFSRVEPIGLKKQISSPFWVRDDVYLCVYQERFSDHPGLYAALSYDGGMTWDEKNAVGIFVQGRAPSSENAFDSGNDQAYTFGYSTLTKLAPGRALVTFWHANGGTTCISAAEIAVTEA